MTTLQQYYDYSSLSLAAYAEVLVIGGNINENSLIEADFTDKQFDQFIADGWEVVDQSSDAKYGSSGFSATLFHNTQTGEYVFANRGTEPGLDDLVFADGWGIATLASVARTQQGVTRAKRSTPHELGAIPIGLAF